MRRIMAAVVGLLVLAGAGWVALERVGLEPLLRRALARLAAAGGPEIRFREASGSLRRGSFLLQGVELERPGPDGEPVLALEARQLALDLAVLECLTGTPRVEELLLTDLRGRLSEVERPRREDAPPGPAPGPDEPAKAPPYRIDHLRVERARLALPRHEIYLEELDVDAPRPGWILHDLLLRGRARGTLDGASFELTPGPGDEVTFRGSALPMTRWGPHFKGIIAWMTAGKIDATVRTRVPEDPEEPLSLQWVLALTGLAMEVPEDEDDEKRVLLAPAVRNIISRDEPLSLRFRFEVPRAAFHGAAGFRSLRLGREISRSASRELEDMARASLDDLGDVGALARSGLEKFLKKKRREREAKWAREDAAATPGSP